MDVVFQTEKAVFNYHVAGILIKNGYVLLHKDVNDKNWALPGGRVEITEESQSSIKREFREELGIDIKVVRLLWVVENFFEYDGRSFHEIGFYYNILSDENSLLVDKESFYGVEGERLIFKWMPIEKLEEVALYPEFLRTALNNLPKNPEHFVEKK
ncbi:MULTISPECIES: NUDIX hydrolase [Bacillus]|uniref:NUDIX hydrolase n=2 Tax=Bacillus TaxID=1386 RepID=A0A0M4G129_9BACI|nr:MULTISPECIES: NUDIX hydrolase [Bacillus]ALC83938.1 NUDIX hydrolase [Bacillus gobiensis]MBP1082987.1 8-oxo-dGTP pyrophosphatase MutT (NUDIX family) [Bacillus capparidis]MED1098037.1 NUDIX hydrolase [Bacillus capparidis]